MIKSEEFKLAGFIDPGINGPGFLIPVFRNRSKLYVQDVDNINKVDEFRSFSLPPLTKIIPFHNERLNRHVGDPALYGFRCMDGIIISDEKEQLKIFLRSRIEEFTRYPFLRLEVLEFLGMFEELLPAINDAAEKLIYLNPSIGKDWKLRAYQEMLTNYPRIKPVVLIVDYDLGSRESLERILKDDYIVLTSQEGGEALEILRKIHIDLVLLETRLPDIDGLELLHRIKEQDKEIEVIIVSTTNLVRVAVKAMKLKAYDFIIKPCEPEDILQTVNQVISKQELHRELDLLRRQVKESGRFDEVVTQNRTMLEKIQLIEKVAYASTSVLISGESGTGKELFARLIHRVGNRKNGPFLTINCAAIPSEIMEIEMFGCEIGAFAGTRIPKRGMVELANAGTLFLDEISALHSDIQVKLLRVLEKREIARIGSIKPIQVDIRVIAATNTNLEDAVSKGKFRRDLYFRLNVIPIYIPPLRERREDIPLLAKHFLNKFNIAFKKRIPGFSDKALGALTQYHWPGNVRELENVIERMVVLSTGDRFVELDDIPVEILMDSGGDIQDLEKSKQKMIEAFEKRIIQIALEAANWEQKDAAKILKINKHTLMQKLKQYGFTPPTDKFS